MFITFFCLLTGPQVLWWFLITYGYNVGHCMACNRRIFTVITRCHLVYLVFQEIYQVLGCYTQCCIMLINPIYGTFLEIHSCLTILNLKTLEKFYWVGLSYHVNSTMCTWLYYHFNISLHCGNSHLLALQ